jgi:hypothetical protein
MMADTIYNSCGAAPMPAHGGLVSNACFCAPPPPIVSNSRDSAIFSLISFATCYHINLLNTMMGPMPGAGPCIPPDMPLAAIVKSFVVAREFSSFERFAVALTTDRR